MLIRELDYMELDHCFYTANGQELCHCTGREVCFDGDDPTKPGNWWVEYEDSNGDLHYGR